jgi:signal transduction histidine kinase
MDLAYAVHELRRPLALQRAILELALADPSADVSVWREVGKDVLCACRQQERLLEACLALARGRAALRRCEPVELATIAGDALSANDCRALTNVVSLKPARTLGDPALVEILVTNLVSNAVCHNVPDGRIAVATRTASGRAVLSVANTGPQIQCAELPCLFQPFRRLGRSGDGLGLGLAIVQAVADTHDAVITARARTGGGLAIDVAFPAHA